MMTNLHPKKGTIETRLKVLTWNVWWRFGPWEERGEAIATTLAEIDVDVIALQEVWDHEGADFAAELAAKLGFHHVYENCMDVGDVGFGNAILSRWPINITDHTTLFGKAETGETRIVIYAEIDGPRGKIPLFNTHINWMYEQSHIRQKQVADIARFIDSKPKLKFPPILCGDFNASPGAEEIRMLNGLTTAPVEGLAFHDAWDFAGGPTAGMTWDNTNPYVAQDFEADRRIDYIFVGLPKAKGAGHIVGCQLAGNQPVNDVYPSDHFAVLAELRY
ncbi:MAG: endonuclease/exonuclease/phosphatase family protein [Paracoccaceae bacterium]|jgi:endonuclease/exonuclease/phosphatase family metal-dependent hydrolase